MVSLSTWARYVGYKLEYSFALSYKCYQKGLIPDSEVNDAFWKNVFQGKLTSILHWNKGPEMVPTIGQQGTTLLVRKFPYVDTKYLEQIGLEDVRLRHVFVGDVVFLKDPERENKYLVRRLAAVEGYEMVSTDPNDIPFVLEDSQCWVMSDNESLKPKEARDSRTFGPVSMADIMGRVIYSLRSAVDHGPIKNSRNGMLRDNPVLAVELDVDEMARNHKT